MVGRRQIFPSPIGTSAWIEARSNKDRQIYSNGMTHAEWLIDRARRTGSPSRSTESILKGLSASGKGSGFQIQASQYPPDNDRSPELINRFLTLTPELQRRILLAFVNSDVRFTGQEVDQLRALRLVANNALFWNSNIPQALEAVFYDTHDIKRPDFLKSRDS